METLQLLTHQGVRLITCAVRTKSWTINQHSIHNDETSTFVAAGPSVAVTEQRSSRLCPVLKINVGVDLVDPRLFSQQHPHDDAQR
jgi:hypothetical protein